MTYINSDLKRLVIERAGNCCEYCLLNKADFGISFHIEHIIAEKHQGQSSENNLCLSCPDCNKNKGSDICSLDPLNNQLIALFNPRKQTWSAHFRLEGVTIEPLTPEGRVTVFLLKLNELK